MVDIVGVIHELQKISEKYPKQYAFLAIFVVLSFSGTSVNGSVICDIINQFTEFVRNRSGKPNSLEY